MLSDTIRVGQILIDGKAIATRPAIRMAAVDLVDSILWLGHQTVARRSAATSTSRMSRDSRDVPLQAVIAEAGKQALHRGAGK